MISPAHNFEVVETWKHSINQCPVAIVRTASDADFLDV